MSDLGAIAGRAPSRGCRTERRLRARLLRLPELATKARARLTRLTPRRAHAGGPARADDQSLPQCRARYCGAGIMVRAQPRRRGWRRCVPHQEHMSMTTDSPQPGGTLNSGRPGRLRARADGRPQPSAVGDQIRTLTVRGRSLRVAGRGGTPGWPPLLLCNGIGASLELLQPFVDALDPRREVVRFDIPGIC